MFRFLEALFPKNTRESIASIQQLDLVPPTAPDFVALVSVVRDFETSGGLI
jgi:hypothetical protein